MTINSKSLVQKINQYLNNEIKKEDLGLWAMKAYYALMKGEYIEIEKLQIYHFLKKISTFHMIPNDITGEYPCSEEEILEIKEILCGKKDMHYTFNIKIFKNIYQNEVYKWRLEEFQKLRKIIDEICLDDISPSVIDTLNEYVNKDVNEIQSLIDLLEAHIKSIIAENIDFAENVLDFRQSVGIYVGGCDINEKVFAPNIKKLLECAMGEIYFRISIIYKKGIPCLSIILI